MIFSLDNDEKPIPRIGKLSQLPAIVCAGGVEAIHHYLKQLGTTGRSRHRAKLIVVGFEKAGKTTLLDSLIPLRAVGLIFYIGFIPWQTWIELQGNRLRLYKNNNYKEVDSEYDLSVVKWTSPQKNAENPLQIDFKGPINLQITCSRSSITPSKPGPTQDTSQFMVG